MHEFTTDTFFGAGSRGTMAEISADQIPEGMWDPCVLNGEMILLNGREQRVMGVETYAIHRTERHPYRKPFSILLGQ